MLGRPGHPGPSQAVPDVATTEVLPEDQRRALVRGRPEAPLHGLGDEAVEPGTTRGGSGQWWDFGREPRYG